MRSIEEKLVCLREVIEFEKNSIDKLYVYNNPDVHDLAQQCLQRSATCLQSCIHPIESNYIGSANALLRQIYEFLVWAKASIDATAEKSQEISVKFFRSAQEQDPFLGEQIQSLFQVVEYDNFPECDEKTMIDAGKYLYKLYSALTHASGFAQFQCGILGKESDERMTDWTIEQVALLADIYLFVLDQYIDKIKDSVKPYINKPEIMDKGIISACLMCEYAIDRQKNIEKHHKCLTQVMKNDVESDPIWLCFIGEWKVKEQKKRGTSKI